MSARARAQWLPLLIIAVLAGASYWLLQLDLPTATSSAPRAKLHRPDYFADYLSITLLDQTGATQYRINAAKMVHYEDNDDTEVVLPAVRAFVTGQPDVTSFAKRGKINSNGSIVDLYDDAYVRRAPGNQDPMLEAESQHFRFWLNDDIVQTEKPVKLKRGASVVTASGMSYNNLTRVVKLVGQVRGMIAADTFISRGASSSR
ncbi:LPS export ABC transporter periplasmic protein LptC [Mycoavidus sp. B2-EB]|uniref:LPS export ABC transporter periplasmic protein LptC n=1 Tax=Mycoavidus sp. B2-EB TaxID=2651972 RepID=UPI0016234AF1|nr:LPS export ABC transporter periplasmic protein LptC [Mycoavidus sp. B2-EB]BBO59356.1 LPS export ABC transporter periplasmic protein LptC [Mycoavidus sp. B2-EB]